ncbi:hypothetical protein AEAC466_13610 [Asticcacaulis sp. AC466]|uniref:hypothetical protein n=1 Tax=Asticcacaulis sp. AC466 TaxID=1282362 RepID=UPI0003C4069E|nr:hypothetical protein [Asticcacaulis sp. AC466]ESQ83283.1 hypothetical protein AEAC466_13610 [Asticcacaulis sp. AC466]
MPSNDPLSGLLPMPTEDELLFMSDELEELRSIIQRNEAVVMAGAPLLAWWGICNSLAGLWNFFEQMGYLPSVLVAPFNAVAGYGGTVLLVMLMGTSKTFKLEGQAIVTAWLAVAVAIPLLVIGCYARGVTDLPLISGLQCTLFMIATAVTAMGSRTRWLLWIAAGWAICAGVMLFAITEFWRPMLFSVACLVLLTAPGIYLFLSSRRTRI